MNSKVSSSNRSLQLATLAVQLLYLNLTLDQANGSDYVMFHPMSPSWNQYAVTGLDMLNSFSDRARLTSGAADHSGFYDQGSGILRGHDVGHANGGTTAYGNAIGSGGQYGHLGGRNKGHVVSGFSTSYHKDERGDKSSYYDDGLGRAGVVMYGGQDSRYLDGGHSGGYGGYVDSSLQSNSINNRGLYGNRGAYHDGGGTVARYNGGRVYGDNRGIMDNVYGYRGGRTYGELTPITSYFPTTKNTGAYIIPAPSKLYFDGLQKK